MSSGSLVESLEGGSSKKDLTVRISYEIIQLFSEGLYKSPHKAVEELVSNSFDAGASSVRILMPRPGEASDSLWVIDNGTGMDSSGFELLWQIAHSPKGDDDAPHVKGRAPIGQFGIGKLAAYVLAWRLTHISRASGKYRFTSMNFKDLTGRHQWEVHEDVTLELKETDEAGARHLLAEIEARDPDAWASLFGEKAEESWTAAALTDFKDLAGRLKEGTLGWVLRTGLPLATDFKIILNGDELVPSKADWEPTETWTIGGKDDEEAEALGLTVSKDGVEIEDLGLVTGEARLYPQSLTGGKSDQLGRSHGFFVRVRGRVINLEDELFGIEALNHAAWARFAMDVEVDGLRKNLLSSREGVRDAAPVRILRKYMHEKFNAIRRMYDKVQKDKLVGIDITQLLSDAPSSLVVDPLVEAVTVEAYSAGKSLYYIRAPEDLTDDAVKSWLEDFENRARKQVFDSVEKVKQSRYGKAAEYDAADRRLTFNEEHPFIAKLEANSKNRTPATLFASSEILTDALVRRFGFDSSTAVEFFDARDRVLRLLAGESPLSARDALSLLEVANQDETAMERAVGAAFKTLGFEYERRGGSTGGPDGVLDARLGRQGPGLADFRLVFDAKTSNHPRIPAGQIDWGALKAFMNQEDADFGFAIGRDFQGSEDENAAVNDRARREEITVLKTQHLKRLLELHLQYGVTLPQIRSLFEQAYSIPQVEQWIDNLSATLQTPEAQVPLRTLLEAIEQQKSDELAAPTIQVARTLSPSLKAFPPEKLVAVLKGVSDIVGRNWIEFDEKGPGIHLQQSVDQIILEVERVLREELGLYGDTN